MSEPKPFCCRCFEDFPVAEEPTGWMMGKLRRLSKAPKKIRIQFAYREDSEIHGKAYLCGNCYFDLTDEDY